MRTSKTPSARTVGNSKWGRLAVVLIAVLDVFLIYLRGLAQPGQWKNTLFDYKRQKVWSDCLCEASPLSALQPYQERLSGRGRRGWFRACRCPGCKALDNEAPQTVAQDLWDEKKKKKTQNEWYLKYSSVRSCISKQTRPLTFCPLGEPWFAQIHSCCTEGAVMLQLRLVVQLNQSNVIQSNSISDHFIPFFFFFLRIFWFCCSEAPLFDTTAENLIGQKKNGERMICRAKPGQLWTRPHTGGQLYQVRHQDSHSFWPYKAAKCASSRQPKITPPPWEPQKYSDWCEVMQSWCDKGTIMDNDVINSRRVLKKGNVRLNRLDKQPGTTQNDQRKKKQTFSLHGLRPLHVVWLIFHVGCAFTHQGVWVKWAEYYLLL